MTHKEKCVCYCKEQLSSRNLLHVFDQSILNSYYTKHNGSQGNAFIIGLKTADAMIEQYKPAPADLEIYNQIFN
jgi:hypothetical protein